MTTIPSNLVKGKLSLYQSMGDSQPYTIDMSAGTTGTAPAVGDFMFIVLDAAGPLASTNVPMAPTGFRTLLSWQAMGTSASTSCAIYVKRRLTGETNYDVPQTSVGQTNKIYAHMLWVSGTNAADVSDWIIGTAQSRAVSGGTVNTVAPSVTTTIDNTMMFAFGLERTSATETEAQLLVTGAGWSKQSALLGSVSGVSSTITVASKGMATAGASGDVTFTAPNTQSVNGVALQIGILPLGWSAPPVTTMPSATVKGSLTSLQSLSTSAVATVDMSAGTTGSALAIGDYVFLICSASGSTSTAITPSAPTGFRSLISWQALGTSGSTTYAVYVKKRASGETNYTINQTNTGNSNYVWVQALWIDGSYARDVSEWVLGTIKNRADSGGTYNTIAPSVTTTLDNTMVFSFGFERTSALETPTDLTVSGTGWTKQVAYIGSGGGSGMSITVASKGMATAGATTDVTFTNINTQSVNGVAFQLQILPSDGTIIPVASFAGQIWDGTQLRDGLWYVVGSTPGTVDTLAWAGMVMPSRFDSITEMLASPDPWYCAHRGGSRNWPEMSMQGYTQSAIRGYDVLEISAARTSDGIWFGLHDASLDRTSLGTGGGSGTTYVASAMTWSAVQTHDLLPASGSPVNSTHQPYELLTDIIDAYIKTHILFIDPKAALPFRTELISILKTYPEWQNKIVAKYVPGNANVSWLSLARTEGFATNAMFYATDTYTTYQAQGDILGMEYNASSGVWTAMLAFGKPVIAHVCPNLSAVTTGITNGASGLMVSGVNQVPRAPM